MHNATQTRQLGELKDLLELKEIQEKLNIQGRHITSIRDEGLKEENL